MTPKEKARELLNKMYGETPVRSIISEIEQDRQYAKQCALIAVDEILNQDKGAFDMGEIHYHFEYWWNVKEEIEKL